MSNDQKPARIKIVNGAAPARAGNAGLTDPVAEIPSTVPLVIPTKRLMRLNAILFILGCAIGGIALAAWPQLTAG